jgi:hypothetical protein
VLLDRLQAESAVGPGAGQDDADRVVPLIFGQRTEEAVDRAAAAARPVGLGHPQQAVVDRQRRIRGDDIDMIRLDPRLVRHQAHRHRRMAGEQLRHQRLVPRIEVLDHHERHAAVRGHGGEQLLEGFEPSGGRTHSHDRARVRPRLVGFPLFLLGLLSRVVDALVLDYHAPSLKNEKRLSCATECVPWPACEVGAKILPDFQQRV